MDTVRVKDEGGVRTVTLNRADRRNALVPEMMEKLVKAFAEAEAAGARVVVLVGEGEGFCSGLDLSVLRGMAGAGEEEHRVEAERVARMFRAVWECDLPTIAAVRGAAMAGGAGLAMLCDFTLAAEDAVFGFSEVKIGFVPALVGAYLAMLVGDKASRAVLLSGRRFGATEAQRMGLVTEVVESEFLETRAMELAWELVRNSPQGMRATKRLLRAQQAEWLESALALAVEANRESRSTEDFKEGIAAFVEKRTPVWRDRG